MSVLISFRSFIELMTTIPFLISNFVPYGQYLYGTGKCSEEAAQKVRLLTINNSFNNSSIFLAELGAHFASQERHENQEQFADDRYVVNFVVAKYALTLARYRQAD